MLLDLLKTNKCFKLVCGAGNEDISEVEKLVTLYSKAGCHIFDVSANPSVINAAKKGLERAGIQNNRYICCSVGIKGDLHISKAYINSETCKKCGKCIKSCARQAILENYNSYKINKIRCIGCSKCINNCPYNAITKIYEYTDLKKVLPEIINMDIDCLEFHAISENESDIMEKWEILNNLYSGPISICIDRFKLGNEKLLKRVKKMLEIRKPYTTIIQADGTPMSGGDDSYKATLQAVATAEIIQNEDLPVYIILSGGTNSKSADLASICEINISGVAIGSYARKIVKEYTNRTDFFSNTEVFNSALTIAQNLVNSVLKIESANKRR